MTEPVATARRRTTGSVEARWLGWLAAVVFMAGLVLLGAGGRDVRSVAGPALSVIAFAFLYLYVLTRRDGHLPIFEAATFFVLATTIYTVIPLLQFAMAGMESLNTGDYRMFVWAPTPQQFGGFAWRHVLLLGTFVIVYLFVRGKRFFSMRRFEQPPPAMLLVILTLVLILRGYFFVLDAYLGPTVSLYEGGTVGYLRLPYFLQQITSMLQMILLTLKQCLVIVLLSHWRQVWWRWLLLLWLAAEAALTVTAMESRTATVVLVLTFMVGYHLIVKPIRVWTAFAAGGLLLVGFLGFGLLRDVGRSGLAADSRAAWGSPTEFMIVYGNAYDVYMRKAEGSLPPLPAYINFVDLYRLVPSQILPFYKWEPSTWYKDEVMDAAGSGMGFLFGIVAQSVLGGDWIELFIRAVLLALFYAGAHRMWRRYSGSFWATIAYLFVLTWAYYAFRLSSFEILYRLVYYLIPAAVTVKLLTMLVSVPVLRRRRMRMMER